MKEYELTIQIKQPHCGGKFPYKREILEIETDDPVEYVKKREHAIPDEYFTVFYEGDELTVYVNFQRYDAKYVFTEI